MRLGRRTLIAAAGALAMPGIARAAAPTRLRVTADRIYLPAAVNGVAVEALLDSAAETSIVDTAFAARLGIVGGAAATASGTGRGTTAARLVTGVTIAAAGLTLHPEAVAVIDLGDIARRLGGPIPLILGRELFDAARLAIDIDGGTLMVVAAGDGTPPGVRLPLTARRGIEAVPVTIEGVPASADFDLGNGATMLVGAAFARTHRLLSGRATARLPGGGIGGEARRTTFTLAGVDLAGAHFADVAAAIDASPTANDANIGVRLLRRFRLTTDFAARAVWLDPR